MKVNDTMFSRFYGLSGRAFPKKRTVRSYICKFILNPQTDLRFEKYLTLMPHLL